MKHSTSLRIRSALLAPAIAIVASVIVSSLALLVSGHSPLAALRAMFDYVTTTDSLISILNRGAPLYVVSLGVAIGFKMNLFNIGADGQYRLAALIAGGASSAFSLPRPLHILAVMLIAMAVGGAWAAVPGVLKVTRNVNEVVSTIMLNFVATGLSAYLLVNYMRNKALPNVAETKIVPKSARLPDLNGFLSNLGVHLPALTVLNGFLPIAIVVGILFYLLIWRTRFGFDLRMTGASPAAAKTSGVSPSAMIVKTIIVSGALAGLAATGFLLTDFPKYNETFPLGLPFTGIAVALLGRNHPGGIAIASFAWMGIETASRGLLVEKIPPEISKILLGSLLISSVISFEVVRRRTLTQAIRQAASIAPGGQSSGGPPPPEPTTAGALA
jgi:general nucleoside transport system permease protein